MNVRVIGDRQTGKTEMLLAYAEKLCRQGQKVLYVADLYLTAHNNLMRVGKSVEGQDGFHAFRGHGNERIVHDSGGEIRFICSSRNAGRGHCPDTLILDDVRDGSEFLCCASARPDVHIVRSSL